MKKILLTLTLLTHLGFSATPEQIEQYLSVSSAEEELIALESQFSAMQKSFSNSDNNDSANNTYDMQLLSVRFKEYLQSHLSEDEMNEILENYRNVVLLQFVSASIEAQEHDTNETSSYLKELNNDSQAKIRISLIEKISKALYSKEAMTIMFDELMKPLMKNGIGGQEINDNTLKPMRENYVKMMIETSRKETLFSAKDFTMEELEALLKVAQTPAVDHETKAVFGAMAYALKEFFISLSNKFDVKKHQPSSKIDINNTK